MADKLEVLPGPGLVARFGELSVWAGPQATPALQAHLVSEAQRLAQAPSAGDQLSNSLIGVLQRGDPEPHTPFAVVGPGANGLTLFLHGPVQAWDSGRWLVPQPVPGWMVTPVARPWPLIILPYGAPPPPQSQQGNPLDLQAGAVPGAGFVLLRPTPPAPPPTAQVAWSQGSYGGGSSGGGSSGGGSSGGGSSGGGSYGGATYGGGPEGSAQAQPGAVPPGPLPGPAEGPSFAPSPAPAAPAAPGSAPTARPAGQSPADLRAVPVLASLPLPSAAALAGSPRYAGAEVAGVMCPRGHLNHPKSRSCGRCGAPLAGGREVNSPRPPLGLLLADDGSVYQLGNGCIIGSNPSEAPEVAAGAFGGISMKAGPGSTMAPVQAAVQARGWEAYLEDRAGGSFVQAPSGDSWSPLGAREQRPLPSGSHISCGGRVLTFLSAWPE